MKKVAVATGTSQANTGTFDYQAFGHIFRSTLGAFYVNLYAGQYGTLFFHAAAVPMSYPQARWNDPTSGTWLSRDPIGFRGRDWNLYRYVGNDPMGRVDPSGLSKCGCQDTCGAITDPDLKKQYGDLLNCIAKATTEDAAFDCIKDTTKDVVATIIIEYVSCYLGGPGTGKDDPLGCDYCSPPTHSFCCDCCYTKYIKSLMSCWSSKGTKLWGLCLGKANPTLLRCSYGCSGACPAESGTST